MRITEITEGYNVLPQIDTNEAMGWATRGLSKVLFSGAYKKALELLAQEIKKRGKDGGSIEHIAFDMLRRHEGGDLIDPRELAQMYRDLGVTEQNELAEGTGAIRGGLAAIALIASLWGVNNNMAQKAYDASPQLQKLTAYLEVAKQHNDQRMIDQLEQRIENHKLRIDIGKGEVMGKDGRAIDVVYDKDAQR